MTYNNQILFGDQTRSEEYFTHSTTPPAQVHFVIQILPCDLFAVANILLPFTFKYSLKVTTLALDIRDPGQEQWRQS